MRLGAQSEEARPDRIMKRILKQAGLLLSVGVVSWGQAGSAPDADRSAAYYNYTLAHLYANLAAETPNGGEYIQQAIDAYKAAINADPRSAVMVDELSDFYGAVNQLAPARAEAEDAIRKNPNDLAAHRMLSRIYLRMISNPQTQRIDQAMLRRAIEEYQKVTELDPKDVGSFIFLGRLQRAANNVDAAGRAFEKALDLAPDDEDALVGLASVYADRGDAQGAAELFQKAAEKNPSAAGWARLAASYEQMREFGLAAETIRKALAMDPMNAPELRKALAQDLLNANEFEEAVDAYEAVAADDPMDPESWLRISQLQQQLGNLAKAREAADKSVAIDPENVEIAFNNVTLLQNEGRPKEAIQSLKKVLEATSKRTYTAQQRGSRIALLERLAVMYRMQDQPADAVAAYREIVQLDPATEARVSAEIVDSLRGGKKLAEAQTEADAAVKKFPNERMVRIAKASLDADMGKAEQAVNDIRKLMDGQDDRSLYLIIAELWEKGRKWDEAGKALDAAEKLTQDPGEQLNIWFMRGAMYEKMKNVPLAEAEFRKVLGVVPDHTAALNYLGYMLTDRNLRLNEALGLIEKALVKEPNNGAYLDSLGWVYFRMGRYADAEKNLKRAVELSPGDPTMYDHYADALVQQKKVAEAVTNWEESLRQWNASSPADKDQSQIDKVRSKLDQARKQLAR